MKKEELSFKEKLELYYDLAHFFEYQFNQKRDSKLDNVIQRLKIWGKELKIRQQYYEVWDLNSFYLNKIFHWYIVIYDIVGNEIQKYPLKHSYPGKYNVSWNAKNKLGQEVSTGVYFIKLSSTSFKSVEKIIFLK